MTSVLYDIAEKERIIVEFYNFDPPVNGIYFKDDDMPPIIGLNILLKNDTAHLRCVLAEELGHHFTTIGDCLPAKFYNYSDRMVVSKYEYKALKWAAEHLIPVNELEKAVIRGCSGVWELAEFFVVTEEMVRFRVGLTEIK